MAFAGSVMYALTWSMALAGSLIYALRWTLALAGSAMYALWIMAPVSPMMYALTRIMAPCRVCDVCAYMGHRPAGSVMYALTWILDLA
jgi:hypothetical protein